jgi:hypothetical protein
MAKAKTRKTAVKKATKAKVAKQEAAVAAEPTAAQLELAKAKEIVTPMAKDKSDEEMLIKLMTDGGFQAKKAMRLLQQSLEDLGVRMSNKDRYTQVSEMLLETNFAPETWDEVKAAVDYIAEQLEATDDRQALVAVRKFAKEKGIDLPVKAKGGTRGQSGFRSQIHAWMRENATGTDADFAAWMKANEKSQGLINYYTRQLQVARDMAAAIVAAG